MSSHGIEFLDLRNDSHDEQYDRLEQAVEVLSTEDSLVVILPYNPTPLFEQITESDSFNQEAFCFNSYQINPEVCLGSISPASTSHETNRDPVTSDTYSSIFASLPMARE